MARFISTVGQVVSKRLTYAQLIGGHCSGYDVTTINLRQKRRGKRRSKPGKP